MQYQTCPFGAAFRRERTAHGRSQWAIAVQLSNHPRNIQRIESGAQQPGVTLALRLLVAAGADPGAFLQSLWEETAEDASATRTAITITYTKPYLPLEAKTAFGLLLLQARKAAGMSQTAMAQRAGYSLRNINAVEKGVQEPGIMAAVALVAAVGADISLFFKTLWEIESANDV